MPCSTGEEPYSIAFYRWSTGRLVDEYEIEIVASDIDSEVLARAREGLYGPRSMQRCPSPRSQIHQREARRPHAGSTALRESIDFACANCRRSRDGRQHRDFNVMFCRNL